MQNTNKFKLRLRYFLYAAPLLFAAIMGVGMLSSCSDNEKDSDEFADWKAKNTKYWNELYNTTKQKIANGDTSWKLILSYSY
ncbi:MAG: FKBP-type peptidyl-prolyl cis-trans isomerase, partial [Prevotella pallens]|nr:FKBP-type peptidyl-prolyl cis-trans isomerase [Prevotella pallens]